MHRHGLHGFVDANHARPSMAHLEACQVMPGLVCHGRAVTISCRADREEGRRKEKTFEWRPEGAWKQQEDGAKHCIRESADGRTSRANEEETDSETRDL